MNRRRHQRAARALGLNRFSIFVPAIMSAGALFGLGAVVQDVLRRHRRISLERRAAIAGRGAARLVSPGDHAPDPAHEGLRHRNAYMVIVVALVAFGAYVFVGSNHNYRRGGGYVEHDGWLLALATVVTAAAGVGAAAAFITWLRWPRPPTWALAVVRSTPLSCAPRDLDADGSTPSWTLTASAILVSAAAVALALFVAAGWGPVTWADEQVAATIETLEWAAAPSALDPIGSGLTALVLLLGMSLATLRCRPLAVALPTALAVAFVVSEVTHSLVDRDPLGGTAPSAPDAFPSDHVMFATLLAGLVPLGVAALFGTHRWTVPLRLVLGVGVIASAIARVHDGVARPSDAFAGAVVGLALVLCVHWAVGHRRWHRLCRGCLWAPSAHGPRLVGLFHFHISVVRAFRFVAHLCAAGAVVVLSVLTVTEGIPTSPDGTGFGAQVQIPVQVGLIGVVSLGALIAWKWEAVGAILMAFGGASLAIFAAMEYPPTAAILLAVMFAIPAVLLWLAWQHRRTMAEIFTVAVVTSVVVGGAWVGAVAMNDYWFGPTHPESAEPFVAVDRVEWMWTGGLTASELTLVVGVESGVSELVVVATPDDGAPVRSDPVAVTDQPAVRLHLDGLRPDTGYRYVVAVDGEPDLARGRGSFRTAAEGASSFTFAVGACARTDSNGAVFDAIAEEDPLFFLSLGDFHYGNLESSEPADHRRALTRQLTTPGQAALYRQVPIAYVWDDHDYGPNDADASSPSRSAARQSYREMVPHYPLVEQGDAAIHQAFTIGRVRFVLTDTRSERNDTTMLGRRQRDWLIDEIATASRTHALVVWGNTVPWIGEAADGGEYWNGYPDQRRLIADALAAAGVENLLMVAGDAHMVGFDDGSNSDYSTAQVGGFPVLHAAALDRRGSEKGGPYSHPTFPGGGRFATVEVTDDGGDEITVRLVGRTWDGEMLIDETLAFPVGAEAR